MKTIHSTMILAALAFGAVAASAPAKADPAPRGAAGFCRMGEADEQCGFATYAQCEASASGLGADCAVDLSADGAVGAGRTSLIRRR